MSLYGAKVKTLRFWTIHFLVSFPSSITLRPRDSVFQYLPNSHRVLGSKEGKKAGRQASNKATPPDPYNHFKQFFSLVSSSHSTMLANGGHFYSNHHREEGSWSPRFWAGREHMANEITKDHVQGRSEDTNKSSSSKASQMASKIETEV